MIQQMLPPESWLLRSWGTARSKVSKETGLAPDSWDAYERNEFSEPRGVHLPIQRMLNSLTWYLIFAVQTACSLCCKLVYSLIPPPASLEQFSQSYWDAVSQAWSCKYSHQVKQLSTFRCDYIFQLTTNLQTWNPCECAQRRSSSWCCYRKI